MEIRTGLWKWVGGSPDGCLGRFLGLVAWTGGELLWGC